MTCHGSSISMWTPWLKTGGGVIARGIHGLGGLTKRSISNASGNARHGLPPRHGDATSPFFKCKEYGEICAIKHTKEEIVSCETVHSYFYLGPTQDLKQDGKEDAYNRCDVSA